MHLYIQIQLNEQQTPVLKQRKTPEKMNRECWKYIYFLRSVSWFVDVLLYLFPLTWISCY